MADQADLVIALAEFQPRWSKWTLAGNRVMARWWWRKSRDSQTRQRR